MLAQAKEKSVSGKRVKIASPKKKKLKVTPLNVYPIPALFLLFLPKPTQDWNNWFGWQDLEDTGSTEKIEASKAETETSEEDTEKTPTSKGTPQVQSQAGVSQVQSPVEKMSPIIDLDDESFEKFFENVYELMKPSASGFSGSGIGSSSQTSFTPEEIAQAKATLKLALGLDITAILESDQFFNLRRSMDILVKSQALAGSAEPALQSFLKELPCLSKSYELANKDLSATKSKLDTIDSIHQALQQKSILWS